VVAPCVVVTNFNFGKGRQSSIAEENKLSLPRLESEFSTSGVLCECAKPIEFCSSHGSTLTRRILKRFGNRRFVNKVGSYHVTELCRCLKQSFLERKYAHLETYSEVWSKQRGNALHRQVSYAYDGWRELPIQMRFQHDNESVQVLGHVDLYDPEEQELIELKSTRALNWQNKRRLLPHRHHALQLQSYYSIWTRCYDLPAERLTLYYMDDQTPPRPYGVEALDRMDWIRQRATILHEAIQQDRTPEAEPNGLCHYCPFRQACTSAIFRGGD
jgi:CRISPR/Cas system-associated exonuclease Cas4 (RecB family)